MVTSVASESSYRAAMEKVKAQFAERLRQAMRQAGYEPRPSVLEREFNLRSYSTQVTLHGVRRWLRGETWPTDEKLLVLAEWLKVSPEQLKYGTELQNRIAEHRETWERLNYQERETLEAFINLAPSQRKIVREVVLAFAKASKAEG